MSERENMTSHVERHNRASNPYFTYFHFHFVIKKNKKKLREEAYPESINQSIEHEHEHD